MNGRCNWSVMRLSSPLHYTENHRFTVVRDFSPGPIAYKMLTGVYQPMIGAVAAGLYLLLLQLVPAERTGYAALELQRRLFAGLDIEPNEQGRKQLTQGFSRLEGVGLLSTFRIENVQTEELMYEYRLFAPLSPGEFFRTEHLRLLLRDKIGDRALEAIRNELFVAMPDELDDPYLLRKDVSMPFHEVFTLAVSAADEEAELEHALGHSANSFNQAWEAPLPLVRFPYEKLQSRVPKTSHNRKFVERLEGQPERIARINFIMDKYGLSLSEIGELLDLDGVFDAKGTLLDKALEHEAELVYLQRYKHEEGLAVASETAKSQVAATGQIRSAESDSQTGDGFPVPEQHRDKFDAISYNVFLKTQPYTKVLQLFLGTPKIMGETKEWFRKLNLVYHISDEVLNAIIHYMQVSGKPWNEKYMQKVAASLQAEHVTTYEQAVGYFLRERVTASTRQSGQGGKGRTTTHNKQKPKLPVYQAPSGKLDPAEKEELDRLVKYLEGKS